MLDRDHACRVRSYTQETGSLSSPATSLDREQRGGGSRAGVAAPTASFWRSLSSCAARVMFYSGDRILLDAPSSARSPFLFTLRASCCSDLVDVAPAPASSGPGRLGRRALRGAFPSRQVKLDASSLVSQVSLRVMLAYRSALCGDEYLRCQQLCPTSISRTARTPRPLFDAVFRDRAKCRGLGTGPPASEWWSPAEKNAHRFIHGPFDLSKSFLFRTPIPPALAHTESAACSHAGARVFGTLVQSSFTSGRIARSRQR